MVPCMARRLQIVIEESVEFLEKQLKHTRTASQKERLQLLWWLKTGQVEQHQELAHRLGRDTSTGEHVTFLSRLKRELSVEISTAMR